MKTTIKLLGVCIMLCCALASCKKKSQGPVGPLGPNYPYGLNNIISPAIIDSLIKDGMKINAGLTPPTVTGFYLFSPDSCTFDNSTDQSAGSIYDDYVFDFTNQVNSSWSIDLAYEDVTNQGTDNGSAKSATIISGGGSLFTLYAQTKDTTQGVISVDLQVISGEFASGGIKNMQLALYVKSKGSDPTNIVVPVGTTRIFADGDGFSQTQTSFSVSPNKIQASRAKLVRSVLSAANRKPKG